MNISGPYPPLSIAGFAFTRLGDPLLAYSDLKAETYVLVFHFFVFFLKIETHLMVHMLVVQITTTSQEHGPSGYKKFISHFFLLGADHHIYILKIWQQYTNQFEYNSIKNIIYVSRLLRIFFNNY